MITKKVLIVDDHKIILESLSLLINSIEGYEVIGTISDSREVQDFVLMNQPDIIITDKNMPFLDGTELTLKLKSQFPDINILMLTVNDNVDSIREAFHAGVSGYITKKASKAELKNALDTVMTGQKFFSDDVMKELLNPATINKEAELQDIKALSARELEIIRLIAQELSSSEIADRLFISTGTVENHRHNILRKLNVKNSIGIIKYAVKYNLI